MEQTVSGDQAGKFSGSIPGFATTDARTATWHGNKVGDYAVTITGGASSCWTGGQIIGWDPDPRTASDSWSTYHYRGGFRMENTPGITVENVTSTGYGDGFKAKRGASPFTLRHVFSDHSYDDCLENDYVNEGLVVDSLLECYVGISSRPDAGQGGDPTHTLTVERTLLRLEPQSNVYKGTVPGTGGWFKTAVDGTWFALRDNTFRADQLTNHQDLRPPSKLVACSGNVILWGGAGTFPERAAWQSACPDTVFVEGAPAVALWNAARAAWLNG